MALMSKSNARRAIIVLGGFVLLLAIFYAEEDWRGKRAWQHCKRELEAGGAVLDWDKFIPPPVPDDQNFFEAPNMAEWFVKNRKASTNELAARLGNKDTTAKITDETAARKYLAWSDQFEPEFELIREALKRPYAWMDGDYSDPVGIPIPNFVNVRIVAQTLAQRAQCYLLLGLPGKALSEVTLLHDLRRLLEGAPTGKPMTMVAAMINVAVAGLYTDTIADGMRLKAWNESQLSALQKQLEEINLPPFVAEALHEEQANSCRIIEIYALKNKNHSQFSYWPRGWFYQNIAYVAVLEQKGIDSFDPAKDSIVPHIVDGTNHEIETKLRRFSPYKFFAAILIPNFSKAMQTAMHNQTLVNEARIACALERCRLSYGNYPATLDVLSPEFIEKLPHDLIGGQPLIYRRTGDGKFLLYSVGWNEKDDGGIGNDWVWGVTR
jgi:hypothetical protein